MTCFDITIVGGGIFGLSIAHALRGSGARVLLLERRRCGAGSSGGLLGALMPHVPDQWNEKKQFQFEALSSMPSHITALEAETGVETGYARLGRIMPVRTENDVVHAMAREAQSLDHWHTQHTGYSFRYMREMDSPTWLNPSAAALGHVHDTLAARISPRGYLAALQAAVSSGVTIREGESFISFADGQVTTSAGIVPTSRVVLAAGYETFALLSGTNPGAGSGIKGQSALLRLERPLPEPLPAVIYDDGIYIVPHAKDLVAVGSTSEREWTRPDETDHLLEEMLSKALFLCPALAGATVVERWAGVRPKARKRDPMLGALDEVPGLYIATGGFKISFGIAHLVGRIMADMLLDRPLHRPLPPSFTLAHHLS